MGLGIHAGHDNIAPLDGRQVVVGGEGQRRAAAAQIGHAQRRGVDPVDRARLVDEAQELVDLAQLALLISADAAVGGHHADSRQEGRGLGFVKDERLGPVVGQLEGDGLAVAPFAVDDGAPLLAELDADRFGRRAGLDAVEGQGQ